MVYLSLYIVHMYETLPDGNMEKPESLGSLAECGAVVVVIGWSPPINSKPGSAEGGGNENG